MARKPKKPTTAVRLAFTGPSVEHDQLIDHAIARNEEDRQRASSAGTSRSYIKMFLDETGVNGKALSWLRMVLKTADKDDGTSKAMDIIMSLEKCLPMVKQHVAGQGTAPMDFDPVEPAAPSYAADFDPLDPDFQDLPLAPVLSTDADYTDLAPLDDDTNDEEVPPGDDDEYLSAAE
ncbi:MAG: hypothetical protein JWQ44_2945 [Chthoniobacter sp.]|nr:hypothetical protein [Chthoniobacter sp.]